MRLCISKIKFLGKNIVFGMVIFCLLIPVHAIALPLYLMLAKLGLQIPMQHWLFLGPSQFWIFLMRQFFMTVPDDLINAARMDGMSEFSIIWKVMLPTAIPAYWLLPFSQLLHIGMTIIGLE